MPTEYIQAIRFLRLTSNRPSTTMGLGKSTKKFQKNHLKDTLDQRKVERRYKDKFLNGKPKKAANSRGVDQLAEAAKVKKEADGRSGVFDDGDAEEYFNQKIGDDLEILKSKVPELEDNDDELGDSEEDSTKSKKIKKTKKSLAKQQEDMKESLEGLKETDPEFYKYLKQNDEGLLDFEVSDLSENEDDGSDSGIEEGDEYPEEVDEDYEEEEEEEGRDLIEVTSSNIAEWKSQLTEGRSLSALKDVIQALQDAIDSSSSKENTKARYAVTDPDVFNELLNLSLLQLPEAIQHHIPLSETATGSKHISGDNKKLSTLSAPLKNFANSLITILRDITDKSVAGLVLKSLSELLPYFITFNKQIKALVEAVAKLWSTTEEDGTRLYAFAFLKTTAEAHTSALLEPILKATYSALIKYSRQSNVHTMGGINFQKNSAATLYGIDPNLSYRLGFQYIRQLAVHLRSSLANKTTEAYKIVYNWQYVHSLDFWSRVLSFECEVGKTELRGNVSPLQELIYPLVQVILGTIRLIPTAQYFPLRFYLIRSLLRLSQTTGVYIPIVPLLTEIFNSTVIAKFPKVTDLKAPDFEYTIRVSKAYLGTKVYQDGVCDQIVDLFGEFFALHSKSVAFPELAIPVTITLRRFTKRSKNPRFNKQLLRLVERLEENAKFIQQKRNKISFGPTNRAQVSVFLKEFDWEKTPIGSYVVVQRQVREERLQLLREAARESNTKKEKKAADLTVGSFESDDEVDNAHDVSDQEPDSDEEMLE